MSLEPIDTPKLCPFCGAYSPRSCELIDDAGYCAWQELPSEIEGCLSLLADARARIAALTAEVARKDEALRRLAYWFETDEDYLETLSEAERTDNNRMLSIARAALDARND